MTKQEAINIFGSVRKLSETLGVTRHAVYMWPDNLTQKTIDQVTGAALRKGLIGLKAATK